MKGSATESVGTIFNVDLLRMARERSLEVLEETAKMVNPGMTESDIKNILSEIQINRGAPQSWHPPQIRVGENTLLSFGRKGVENLRLKEDDIFFIDIGPIFDGHEGDVGRSFSFGKNSEMNRCCVDVRTIWKEVRDFWLKEKTSGKDLYHYATQRAADLGWRLCLEQANGHRIADFPHAVRNRGSIEEYKERPSPDRWILEIQIRHHTLPFGAFYEDLL